MNACVEMAIIVFLAIVLLAKPKVLCNCSKSILGKSLFAIMILGLASYNIVYGLVGILLYIVLNTNDNDNYDTIEIEMKPISSDKPDCITGTPKVTPLLPPKPVIKIPENIVEKEAHKLELLTSEEKMRPCDSKKVLVNMNKKTLGGEVNPYNN
tara:strand:- start:152 stop:613 length:462 start_codon:yes stop_codon:yes gene_type:complete